MKFTLDIILPNYNKEEYLEETINSITDQTFNDWKLIIIDNCSTDNSKKIINKYNSQKKIHSYFFKKNMGVSFSRNFGMRMSNSKYISFIDADDLWTSDKLQNQINFMEKYNYDFTYTDYTPFFDKKKRIFKKRIWTPQSFNYEGFINNSSIGTSSMILSRKIIGVTKFPRIENLEDFSFKCKILKKTSKAIKLNENSTFYRITKGSMTSNKFKNIFWLWYINKNLNNLNFFRNCKSLFLISINSLKKYGFK
jgi:teichuronic acid biosynthesis glycosyltransferase TuaG|tara:strand:- start:61 stop:816 length:756 start_codon:yes stop_codon:yes gene_type:complete